MKTTQLISGKKNIHLMNMKSFLYLQLILLGIFVLLIGCQKDKSIDKKEIGANFISNSDCKSNTLTKETNCNVDSIYYEYKENKLIIHHFNAGFNCCPEGFSINVNLGGIFLTIEEQEIIDIPCNCNCLFDINYEVLDLLPGEYIIKIIEPYVHPDDEILEFCVDLISAPSGSFYLTRDYYPWCELD